MFYMKRQKLHATNLVMRCMAMQRKGYWVALCLDLDLAAQASTVEGAKKLLREQMRSYLEDAMTIDTEHGAYLLKRRAPLRYLALYYAIKWFNHAKQRLSYEAALPVMPAKA
jgi:hypothetical protein